MKKYKVAVIGAGFAGQQHIDAVRRIPGCEIAALADPDLKRAKAVGDSMGIERVYADYRQMIKEQRPDVIHNCTPNAMHFEINRYAFENGCHVYCEKPLAVSTAEGEELIRLSKQYKRAAGVNLNYRNNPIVQEMRVRIANGSMGKLFHISGHYYQDWMMLETDYNWRLQKETGGESRTVADIGSHWFDTVQTILGKKIIAVNANLLTVLPVRKKQEMQTETFQHAQGTEYEQVAVDTEDAAFIQLQFEGGVYGNVNLSQVIGGHLNDFRIEIAVEKGSLEWRQETPDYLQIGTRASGMQTICASPGTLTGDARRYSSLPGGHPEGWSDALRNGIREFYSSIAADHYAEEKQTYATFADGVQLIRLTEACLQSAKEKKWVYLEGDDEQ